jgi:hypothetical protein
MSIGPMGNLPISAAGSPLTQSQGTEADRSRQTSAAQQRQAAGDESARQASGIGQASQDQEASDRDADGRRLWEKTPRGANQPADDHDEQAAGPPHPPPDPSGESGGTLDVTA